MNENQLVEFHITDQEPNADHCLTFYRHMYGNDIGTLQILLLCCDIGYELSGGRYLELCLFLETKLSANGHGSPS